MQLPTNFWGYVVVAWPIITAVASLIYPLLDETKWGHAALSFLAALGLDLPKLFNALQRLFGPSAAAKASKTLALLLLLGGLGGVAAVVIEACIPNPASQVSDGLTLEQCVQREWGQPVASVIATCGPNIASAVVDVISDLVVFLDKETDGGASGMIAVYANDYRVTAALPRAQLRYAAKHQLQAAP